MATPGIESLNNTIWIAVGINIANTMGIANIAQKSATSPWPIARAVCIMFARKEHTARRKCISNTSPSEERKDLNTFVDAKIANIIDHCKKKELVLVNKFEVLLISSGSNGDGHNNKSKVSHTSKEGSNSK
eukprot:6782850-Ditylum_brightwellii.AAC.1